MTLSCIVSDQTNPYYNLALEEYLLWNVAADECILYLWQNRRAVVIGMNQNPWRECRIKKLEDDNGLLARRMSGGGAVYHDLGNLNFTFLTHEGNYDTSRQLAVIIRAASKFGIQAERSERNDLLADGRKFSGNAFYRSRGRCYHHGTLLVDTDMTALADYLNVASANMQSKGVASVRSRVVNLRELSPDITVASLQNALIASFGEIYDDIPQPFSVTRLDDEQIARHEKKYASWDWRLGRCMPFTVVYSRRFAWGELTLRFCVESGIIKDALASSADMNTRFITQTGDALRGGVFSSDAIKMRMYALADREPVDAAALDDIICLINEI